MNNKKQNPEEPQPNRFERIKKHFKNHKEAYLASLGTLAIATIVVAASNATIIEEADQVIVQKNYFGKSKNVVINLEERSTPSKPVHLVGTDLYFDSMNDAARKTGISLSAISNNVNGKTPDAQGEVFELLTPA